MLGSFFLKIGLDFKFPCVYILPKKKSTHYIKLHMVWSQKTLVTV